MLSRWRKAVREGQLRGKRGAAVHVAPPREIRRLQELQRAHALLQEEHALLKKAIRFWATRKLTSSRSSTRTGATTRGRGPVRRTASRGRPTTPGGSAPSVPAARRTARCSGRCSA